MLTLFRGDHLRIGEQPFSDYLVDGLRSKILRGGSTAQFAGRDFIDIVLAHVGWEDNTPEAEFARKTPMISFSADRAVADWYMRQQRLDLIVEPCPFRHAKHFMIALSVDWSGLSPTRLKGVRLFEYERSHVNCRAHMAEPAEDLPLLGFFSQVMDGIAIDDRTTHRALIINVVEFLDTYGHRKPLRLLGIAVHRATRDKEWLLWPADPLDGDPSMPSAIFQANEHMTVSGYRSIP